MNEIDPKQQFEFAFQNTKILRLFKQSLFTFSPTDVEYYLLTQQIDMLVEVRQGKVEVEKPKIISPEAILQNYFEGFENEHLKYIEMIFQKFKIRGLEYKYKNRTDRVDLVSGNFDSVLDKVNTEFARRDLVRTVIIKGVPCMWGVSLMKSVTEIIAKSFPENIKELNERGWFDR